MRIDKISPEEATYILTKNGRVGLTVGISTQVRSDGKFIRIRYMDGLESVSDLFENISPSDIDVSFDKSVWESSFVDGKISIEKIKNQAKHI